MQRHKENLNLIYTYLYANLCTLFSVGTYTGFIPSKLSLSERNILPSDLVWMLLRLV